MSFDAFRTFFALLTLVAAGGAVVGGIAVLQLRTGRPGLGDTVAAAVRGAELKLAFVVALTATLGSLYLSEIAHLEPCRLCWYQRIAMYPLALILGIAAWKDDGAVRRYAMPLAGIGGLIAAYHYLVQRYPNLESGACDVGVPCSAAYFWEFGFISIPFMALSGFAAVAALLTLHRHNQRAAPERSRKDMTKKRSTR